jgi:hypothetical protein
MLEIFMNSKPTVVVMGFLGGMPVAGVAWQVLHYLEGFRRLGWDVYYVEDTGAWPYDPEQNTVTGDCRYSIKYLARLLAGCGLEGHWAYRSASDGYRYFGLSEAKVMDLFRHADVLLNLTGSTELREEHAAVPVRIYLETDPVLPQIEVAQGNSRTIRLLAAHTHHFTYGENLGAEDCAVPLDRFPYLPTRQPVVLDWWQADASFPLWSGAEEAPAPPTGCFTTVGNWEQKGKDIEWQGERYAWSKHHEFLKFLDLPRWSGQRFELALSGVNAAALRLLRGHGWRIVDALGLSKEIAPYREYIRASRGEFTVAKDQNIRLRSGWFSDRSACYLAAGRPVITQDTGFGNVLPTGWGLFAFRTKEDILAAFDAIAGHYEGHCQAAREIAAEYFAAEKVVGDMMERAGVYSGAERWQH